MIFTNSNPVTSAAVSGLPAWMTDGKLLNGQVPSSCKLRQAVPGMPLQCNPVHPEFLHAIYDLLEGKTAVYGSNTAKCYIAEDTVNGASFATAFARSKVYGMKDGNTVRSKSDFPLRMVFLLSMPFFMGDKEFADAFDGLKKATDDVERQGYLATMYDNAYMRDAQNEVTTAYEGTNLVRLTETRAKTAEFMPTEQVGEAKFAVFENVGNNHSTAVVGNIATKAAAMSGPDFNGAFRVVDPAMLSEDEKRAIITLDDRFYINQQHVDVARTIKNSLGGRHPFCNYLFRGQPGGGKSTFVKILAAGLGLPFYCDVMKDDLSGDFFSGYFAPDVDSKGRTKNIGIDELIASMPSPEDMAFDPVTAYETITGKVKEDATAMDCQLALVERIQNACREVKGESKNALMFVEGLVPKLERPSLIFYDEVTAPKNPAAITALNTLMDNQRIFTLSTGRVIHRHPLSVMCFAGNFSEDGLDLEGAHDPNRTWQDRNNEILNIAPPSPAETKAMLVMDTGYDAAANANIPIDLFVSIMPELQKISADYYGVCGFRALSDWLAKSMLTGSPLTAAETTVITKASNDPKCQAELRTKIRSRFRF